MTDLPVQPEAILYPRNLKMVIAYNGAAYHGWQRQLPEVDTVQQRVERALMLVLRHPLHIHGASRTDAGVHAEGQVAHVRTSNLSIPVVGLRRAVNSRLPADIVLRSLQEAPLDFHAQHAVGKTYRYRIHVAPSRPVSLSNQVYCYWRPLDVEPMRDAAKRLFGEHDFRGFASSVETRENTVRTIFRCEVAQVDSEIVVHVQGGGFLYNMVRNIVGTLVEVGRGHWQPEQVDKVLASRNRADAGPTAPPDGLTLVCVHYGA
jgi:tRNA pseudouridine38-40 synthase